MGKGGVRVETVAWLAGYGWEPGGVGGGRGWAHDGW